MVLFDFWACFYPRKEASGGGKIAGPGEGMRGAANVIPPGQRENTWGRGGTRHASCASQSELFPIVLAIDG